MNYKGGPFVGAKPAHRGQLSDNYSCSRNTERVLSCLQDLVLLTPAASLLQPPEFLQQTQEGLGCQLTGAVRCAVLGDAYLTPKFSLHPCDYSMLDSARKKKKWRDQTNSLAGLLSALQLLRQTMWFMGMGGLSTLLVPWWNYVCN